MRCFEIADSKHLSCRARATGNRPVRDMRTVNSVIERNIKITPYKELSIIVVKVHTFNLNEAFRQIVPVLAVWLFKFLNLKSYLMLLLLLTCVYCEHKWLSK